jgi:hypothetical protein
MDFIADAPTCNEDMRLLEEFAAATEGYFEAVKHLQQVEGGAQISKAMQLAELARVDCANAREAVVLHRTQHGCRNLGVHTANHAK